MKKNEVMEINGKRFVVMVNKPVKEVAQMTRRNYRSIWQAYNRPSDIKINIWENWKRWFSSFNTCDFWIESRNSEQFTIGGYLTIDGKLYNVYISKCRQELYPVI